MAARDIFSVFPAAILSTIVLVGFSSVIAAQQRASASQTVEGDFVATAPLLAATVMHSATVLANSDVLVVGGYGKLLGLPVATTLARIYDHNTHVWRAAKGNLNYGRFGHAALLHGNS